jgi:hypothetical protein
MNNEKIEPPCKIEEILTFNFDNLIKFVSFLQQSDTQINSKIKSLNLKISEIDNFKTKVEEAEFKLNLAQNKFKETEATLNAHQKKLIDLDSKFNFCTSHLTKHDTTLKDFSTRTDSLEENINNLNRISEEHIKYLRKLNEATDDLRLQQEKTKVEAEKNRSEVCGFILQKNKETEISFDKKLLEVNEAFNKIARKIESTEDSLIKIAEIASRNVEVSNPDAIKAHNKSNSVAAATNGLINVNTNSNNNSNTTLPNHNQTQSPIQQSSSQSPAHNNNFNYNIVMTDMNKILQQMDWLKNENQARKESIENMLKTTEELGEIVKISKSQNVNNLSNIILDKIETDDFIGKEKYIENRRSSIMSNEPQLLLNNLKRDTLNDEGEIFYDNIDKLNDNIKLVSQNINNKVTKDELDKLRKVIRLEIEKVNEKFSTQIKNIDTKLKNFYINNPENKISAEKLDRNSFSQMQDVVSRISKEIFEKEISNLNFSEFEVFQNTQDRIEGMKTEIDKIFESLVDIRKNFLQSKLSKEDEIKESNLRILELENLTRNQKIQIDDIMRIIEGDSFNSNTLNYSETKNFIGKHSIRELIKNLNSNLKQLNERIDKLQTKQNNQNAEILNKVKKDLQFESNRILDDFKYDLRSSISKIQEQLKEKVDRLNLDEFGKKIDNKMLIEIGKKLDKNDLRKNNNMINKKIDTLQNKISKSLVNTLIDLQLDEAPLIVKQSMNGEKCASCNQVMQNPHPTYENIPNTIDNRKTVKSMNNTRYQISKINPIDESDDNLKMVGVSQLPEINSVVNKTNPDFFVAQKKRNKI